MLVARVVYCLVCWSHIVYVLFVCIRVVCMCIHLNLVCMHVECSSCVACELMHVPCASILCVGSGLSRAPYVCMHVWSERVLILHALCVSIFGLGVYPLSRR